MSILQSSFSLSICAEYRPSPDDHDSFVTTFYMENFIFFGFCQLKRSASKPNNYVLDLPLLDTDGPVGAFSVVDTGKYVVAVLKDPKTWIGALLCVLRLNYYCAD